MFSYLNDFSYFPLKQKFWKLQDTVGKDLKWPFWKGRRWFQLFFIDFQLFYFLTGIIPGCGIGKSYVLPIDVNKRMSEQIVNFKMYPKSFSLVMWDCCCSLFSKNSLKIPKGKGNKKINQRRNRQYYDQYKNNKWLSTKHFTENKKLSNTNPTKNWE